MKAIILAGGKGTRLQSLVSEVPKPMAPVAGKPFLEYLILQLKSWSVNEIIFSVGYKKEIIRSYFSYGEKWDVNITYMEEDEPLGTGGAIRQAMNSIGDHDVMVLNGDSFINADLASIIGFHEAKKALATMTLTKLDNTSRYGKVHIDDDGRIMSFMEKNADNSCRGTVNAGLYVLNSKIVKYLSQGNISFEIDVLPKLVGKELFGVLQDGFFIDIGIPKDYSYLCNNPEFIMKGIS